jgi:beta-barrel assembly-enhancing protease
MLFVRFLAFLLVLVSCSVPAMDQELPLLGENASLKLKAELQLGQGLFDRLKEAGYVIEDPLLSRYLSDIGETLLSHLDIRLRDYHFFLVKDTAINAFAAPGGFIGVNAGLIAVADTEDELASVLAHEIAHIELTHTMQMIEKSQELNKIGALSILAAILLSGQNPDVASAMLYGGAAGSTQSIVNFTRSNEYEADRVGVELLKKSHYNPAAMADFMLLLQRQEQTGALANIEYIRTHPISSNRIAEIRSRVGDEKYQKNEKNGYVSHYQEFRDYLSYIYPASRRTTTESTYYHALSLMYNGKYEEAGRILANMSQKDPDNIWISYALAESKLYQRSYDEAIKIYKALLLIYPDDLAITIKLVNTLIQKQQYSQALQYAQSATQQYEQDPRCYQMLVEIYKLQNKPTLEQLAEANYHWYSGNQKRAEYLYTELLNKGSLDIVNEQKVKDKLAKEKIQNKTE